MAKVLIDTESTEARDYIAYLLWSADNGSKPGARSDRALWAKYDFAAGLFLENLVNHVPTTVYAPISETSHTLNRVGYRESHAGIEVIEE